MTTPNIEVDLETDSAEILQNLVKFTVDPMTG